MTFRHNCKFDGCWIETQPDWGQVFGNNFFAGRSDPTDIDGMVELNGHFLTLEWKGFYPNGNPVKITRGQYLTFRERVKTGVDTVFMIWAKKMNVAEYLLIWTREQQGDVPISCTPDELRQLAGDWVRAVYTQPRGVKRQEWAFTGPGWHDRLCLLVNHVQRLQDWQSKTLLQALLHKEAA